MEEADSQIGVFEPPSLVLLVETIDGQQVLPPGGEIAGHHPLPASGGKFTQPSGDGAWQKGKKAVDLTLEESLKPSPHRPGMRRQVFGEYAPAQILTHEDTISRNEPPLSGEPAVPGDESSQRKAIPIGKDHIISICSGKGAVPDRPGPESTVLLADMTDFDLPPPLVSGHGSRRLRTGAVIGHDDLEVAITLGKAGIENGRQGVGTIVGCHDEGDLHGGRLALSFSVRRRSFR